MNEGTASGPHHEDRSDAGAGREAEASPPPSETGAQPPATAGETIASRPLHPEDPYGTPPYGGPGPWAPAPPVQRPVPTPPRGTTVPTPLPPPPAPAAPQPPAPTAPASPAPAPHSEAGGPWERYDPWAAPSAAGTPTPGGAEVPRKHGRGRIVAGAVVLALVAGGVGGVVGAYIERDGGVGDVRLPQVSGEQTGRAPDSVAGIARTALPGVVTLHVRGGGEEGTGTGFVLDRRGHLLTNNHVVEAGGADGEISVTFSGGSTATGRVVGRDSGYDLAVVKVDGVSDLKPLTLGNSDDVRVGDPVVAIGAPFDLANTVTAGIISAKQRPITAGGEGGAGGDVSYVDALQTDAPINPGNSGGPLVDGRAHVIGINSAIRAAGSGDTLGAEQGGSIGLGFAIPINQGKRVAEELINNGRATHPVIGVMLDMGYSGDGARVSAKGRGGGAAVTPGGPGARAGIKAGDLITEVDGGPVHSGEELIVKIRSHRPGDRLKLTVERDGRPRTVEITLGSSTDQS
ncbi:trypsin-like peptidase domain-containing protein [Streptomyces sp. NPDC050315]|uniref:S1C family serine protease n=1 Tax=Streptomyces sp. NPDC050315 TaxID=3155039 RepID=UPI003417BC68